MFFSGRVVSGRVVSGRVVSGRVVSGWVVPGRVVSGKVVSGRVVSGKVVSGTVVSDRSALKVRVQTTFSGATSSGIAGRAMLKTVSSVSKKNKTVPDAVPEK